MRLVVVIGSLFVFVFPSLIGMNLFYLDLFARHPELQGFPDQPAAVEAFFDLAGDATVREVVLGLIFSTGLIFILGASHGEPRLSPVLDALGMLLVMYSLFFLLVASDRCIAAIWLQPRVFYHRGRAGFGIRTGSRAHSALSGASGEFGFPCLTFFC